MKNGRTKKGDPFFPKRKKSKEPPEPTPTGQKEKKIVAKREKVIAYRPNNTKGEKILTISLGKRKKEPRFVCKKLSFFSRWKGKGTHYQRGGGKDWAAPKNFFAGKEKGCLVPISAKGGKKSRLVVPEGGRGKGKKMVSGWWLFRWQKRTSRIREKGEKRILSPTT